MGRYCMLWATVRYHFCAQLFPWWWLKLCHWFLCSRQGKRTFPRALWQMPSLSGYDFHVFFMWIFSPFFFSFRLLFSPLTPEKQLTIELVTMFFSGHSLIWGKRNDWLHAAKSPHAYKQSLPRGLFILSALLLPGDQNAWPQWPLLLWCSRLVVWSLGTMTLKQSVECFSVRCKGTLAFSLMEKDSLIIRTLRRPLRSCERTLPMRHISTYIII